MGALLSMVGMGGSGAAAAGGAAGAGSGLAGSALGAGTAAGAGTVAAAAPIATGATTGASLGSSISAAMPYVQGANQLMNMIGPNGSLTKGNPQAIMNDVQGAGQTYDKLFGTPASSGGAKGSPEVLGRGTTESFSQLPPDIQSEVLKIMMGNN